MAQDSNLAYALEQFEAQQEGYAQPKRQIEAQPMPKVRTIRPATVVRTMICMVYVIALSCGLLYARVLLTQQNDVLIETKAQLSALQDEQARLQLDVSEQMNLKNIAKEAIEEYEMQAMRQNQIRYVVVEQENKMETVIREETVFDKIYQWYLEVKEYLFG